MIDRNLQQQWEEEGYVVVRGLFDPSRTARLRDLCFEVLGQWRVCNPEKGDPGGGPESTVMRHLNHIGYFRKGPDGCHDRDGFRDLMHAIADEGVLDLVRTILMSEPMFRCTSLFFNPQENPRDGNWHRDTQFRSTHDDEEREMILSRAGFGSGVQLQVALVASDDVELVPRSHLRWDTDEEYRIRKADDGAHNKSNTMPNAIRVCLEPGDAVGFNAAGLHRGRYHSDRLRHTLMLTYTRADMPVSDYFSHQPWFLEPDYLAGLDARVRIFFDKFVAQYQAEWHSAPV
jgi:ectoine hydroxylase-related dioxygenase (phytanoyl-CoA dioxygenase family)